jgi:hypothetical protein
MEHVVFSAAQDGAGEEFRRVASLEEAVRVVEHLRNDLGITDPSVFALTPVPVAFRTYYRVEVPGLDEPVLAEPAPAEQPSLELLPAEPASFDTFDPFDTSDTVETAELVSEAAEADGDFLFDGNADMDVPGILPEGGVIATIPASRGDDDREHSLGYFAR